MNTHDERRLAVEGRMKDFLTHEYREWCEEKKKPFEDATLAEFAAEIDGLVGWDAKKIKSFIQF